METNWSRLWISDIAHVSFTLWPWISDTGTCLTSSVMWAVPPTEPATPLCSSSGKNLRPQFCCRWVWQSPQWKTKFWWHMSLPDRFCFFHFWSLQQHHPHNAHWHFSCLLEKGFPHPFTLTWIMVTTSVPLFASLISFSLCFSSVTG